MYANSLFCRNSVLCKLRCILYVDVTPLLYVCEYTHIHMYHLQKKLLKWSAMVKSCPRHETNIQDMSCMASTFASLSFIYLRESHTYQIVQTQPRSLESKGAHSTPYHGLQVCCRPERCVTNHWCQTFGQNLSDKSVQTATPPVNKWLVHSQLRLGHSVMYVHVALSCGLKACSQLRLAPVVRPFATGVQKVTQGNQCSHLRATTSCSYASYLFRGLGLPLQSRH